MPRRFVFVVVWVAGVAVAMLLATAAVGLVGDRVASRPVPRLSEASVEATLRATDQVTTTPPVGTDQPVEAPGAGPPAIVGPSSGARVAEGSGGDRSAAARPGDGSATSPPLAPSSGSDGLSGSSGSGESGSGSTPDGSGPAPTASTLVRVTATFSAEGGSVGVVCVGTTISRTFVTPAAGFALDASGSAGPSEVDVRFRSTNDGRDSRIRVTCPGGVPIERIDT